MSLHVTYRKKVRGGLMDPKIDFKKKIVIKRKMSHTWLNKKMDTKTAQRTAGA